ncbi:MAG: hypothetical protein ACI9TV_000537 [Sulfurimonas sp.]|jgi:hypothetical protein|uniref:hypothetical protein n=1 Tax=Sulfurimonas sp. TaxID=2022749 RepID=UPI0039E3FFE3
MKTKSFVTFALLFVLSFSIAHEYVFALFDDDHASVIEYVAELEAPSDHGDICDAHFEYHQSFVLTENLVLSKLEYRFLSKTLVTESYNFKTYSNFLKPPIA